MQSHLKLIIAALAWAALWSLFYGDGPSSVRAAPPDYTLTLTEVAAGFSRPLHVTHAGDGSNRLFVTEQDGRINIMQPNGDVLPTPFLDISSLVLSPADGSGNNERGLLGLAFHPNYASNGYFYVNYTNTSGHTRIVRYTVSGNPNLADAGSALTLLSINQPRANHNGGQLLFGPDGYLYIGMGDSGGGNDPDNAAQNKNSLLGKLLRIDVNQQQGGKNYAIPPDNPYVGIDGVDEVWAIGLRNPWRFSFDRLTGDLYLGDVGQNAWEEIDFQAAGTAGGLNFGWVVREGPCQLAVGSLPCAAAPAQYTDPIASYPHSSGSRSVTGGFVYRGQQFPALAGRYFYGDFISGRIWSLQKVGDSVSTPVDELDTPYFISAFGENEAGELYLTDLIGGKLYQLADAAGPASASLFASHISADVGQAISYTVSLQNIAPLGDSAALTVTVPGGLGYVSASLTASQGTVDDSIAPVLYWQGQLTPTRLITVTYAVTATGVVTGPLVTPVQINGPTIAPATLFTTLYVPKFDNAYYFPVIFKE